MKAIILVAGYATRLYPLTLTTPKALLPIGGKPMIEYIMDEINTIEEIDAVYAVTNSKFYGHFQEWAAKLKSPKPVKVLDDGTLTEETRRGAIGDILFTLTEEKIDDDVLIVAGDNFFTYKLKDYYDYYKKWGCDCVVVKELDDVEQLRQFAVAKLDADDKILELVEKPQEPESNIAVYATYIYKRETLPLFEKYLSEGNKKDAPGYFVQWLHKVKDVRAYRMQGDCYDIGTQKFYNEVQELVKKWQ